MNTLRPTLAELVPAYAVHGITPRAALRYIVDSHLRSVIARGKGARAQRRRAAMLTATRATAGLPFAASTELLKLQRARQLAADVAAELHGEGRLHRNPARHVANNFHE